MEKFEVACKCFSCNKLFDIKISNNEDISSGNIFYCEYCGGANKVKLNKNILEYAGAKPSDEDLEWIKSCRELIIGGSDRVDTEAKSLVTLGSSLLTIYIGAMTFLKATDQQSNVLLSMSILSIILWLISIGINLLWVSFPREGAVSDSSPSSIANYYVELGTNKFKIIEIGRKVFLLALVLSVSSILISVYISNQDAKLPHQVQFLISSDQIQTFENMSVGLESNKMKTDFITLIDETENTYKIKLVDGRVVEFKKDLANGLIYKRMTNS